jgi:hypothetical protein
MPDEAFARYLSLQAIDDADRRHSELVSFFLVMLDGKDDALKGEAAAGLRLMLINEPDMNFTEAQGEAIAAAARNSTHPVVVARLCSALDLAKSPCTIEVARHAFSLPQDPHYSLLLGPIVARNKPLLDALVSEAGKPCEAARLNFLLRLLSSVPEEERWPILAKIWGENEQARPGVRGYVFLQGSDKQVEQFLAIKADAGKGNGDEALTAYLLALLSGENRADRSSAALMLLGMFQSGQDVQCTEGEMDTIFRALKGSDSHEVAVPLCLVLEGLKSDKIIEACRHALFETDLPDVGAESLRAKQIVAMHNKILMVRAADARQANRILMILKQRIPVPDHELLPVMKHLWGKNPDARPAIRRYLNYAPSPERLKFLEEINGPPKE